MSNRPDSFGYITITRTEDVEHGAITFTYKWPIEGTAVISKELVKTEWDITLIDNQMMHVGPYWCRIVSENEINYFVQRDEEWEKARII